MIASRAVKQPAVFGSSSTPQSSITSTSEPRAPASMRRSATVTIAVPLTRIASASVSSRVKPPVPRISRDGSSRPAIVSACAEPVVALPFPPIASASLHRGQRLDARAGRHGAGVPLGARDDLAVDRHGDAARARLDAELGEQLADGPPVAASSSRPLTRSRRAPPRSASAANGAGTRSSPASSAASRSPVTGASRIPLRWCPVAQHSPSSAPAPSTGALSGVPGRRPAARPPRARARADRARALRRRAAARTRRAR